MVRAEHKKPVRFDYINSLGERFAVELSSINPLDNLMEVIRDFGYEDWGQCRGRAMCCSCHISVTIRCPSKLSISVDEKVTLNQLNNRTDSSRLACQIPLDDWLDGAEFSHLGDY